MPAIAETLPGFTDLLWIAVYAPQGIPAAVETQPQGATKKVLEAADTKETLVALGVDLANATPAQLAALLVEDLARWSKIVKESGATHRLIALLTFVITFLDFSLSQRLLS